MTSRLQPAGHVHESGRDGYDFFGTSSNTVRTTLSTRILAKRLPDREVPAQHFMCRRCGIQREYQGPKPEVCRDCADVEFDLASMELNEACGEGTRAGYKRHQYQGTPACPACLSADRAYFQERRAKKKATA